MKRLLGLITHQASIITGLTSTLLLQMLQQVAGENHIHRAVLKEAKIVGWDLVEFDPRLEHVGTVGVQIDTDGASRTNLIPELVVAVS